MQAAVSERERRRAEDSHLVVPPTPTGVASALSVLGVPNRKLDPAESLRSSILDPSTIEVEVGADAPVARTGAEPDVVCSVPPRLDALFVVAPVAHYLGSRVTIDRDGPPRVRIPDHGVERTLGEMPDLQDAAGRLLDRVLSLDRHVVDGAAEAGPLEEAGVDRERLRRAPPGERLAAALEVPTADAADVGRGWDLAMYVDPVPANLSILPHLLARPCAIFLPEAAPVERDDLIRRSLEDFYRAGSPPSIDVDLVTPTRRRGRVRGWLADGVAVDAFKATPAAYENRRAHREPSLDHGITVVLNESAMAEEVATVEHIYCDTGESAGVDVEVERHLTREELAETLERPTAFLHYVGHCDEGGLRCADGTLPIDRIDRSRVRTFLLNACGSYREGRSLIRRGSVAGAVTLNPVLDDQAAKVGVAFARLVMAGFCIERALRIARRRAIMNKDYVVIGDGTYALECGELPGGRIERREADRFRFELEGAGCDEELAVTLTRPELLDYLERAESPVVFEGRSMGIDAIRERLRT